MVRFLTPLPQSQCAMVKCEEGVALLFCPNEKTTLNGKTIVHFPIWAVQKMLGEAVTSAGCSCIIRKETGLLRMLLFRNIKQLLCCSHPLMVK